MHAHLTIEYWLDDGWYVGVLKEVPGVFSQGKTLPELEKNIREAYRLMTDETRPAVKPPKAHKEILVEV